MFADLARVREEDEGQKKAVKSFEEVMAEEEQLEKVREEKKKRQAEVQKQRGGVMQFDYNDPYKLALEKKQKPQSIFSQEDFG
jgi:uncharacterized lipoprotein YddW (UPF0748 family)